MLTESFASSLYRTLSGERVAMKNTFDGYWAVTEFSGGTFLIGLSTNDQIRVVAGERSSMSNCAVGFISTPSSSIKKVVPPEFVKSTFSFFDMHISKKKIRKTDLPEKVVSKYVGGKMPTSTYQCQADRESSSQITHQATAPLLHSGYDC